MLLFLKKVYIYYGGYMKIRELRKEKKLSQENLAKELMLSKNQVLRFENGQTAVPSDVLVNLADYFDVSLDYLCDRPYSNNVGYIPDSRKDLVREIVDLSDSEAREVEVFIKGFKAGRAGRVDFYDDDNKRG